MGARDKQKKMRSARTVGALLAQRNAHLKPVQKSSGSKHTKSAKVVKQAVQQVEETTRRKGYISKLRSFLLRAYQLGEKEHIFSLGHIRRMIKYNCDQQNPPVRVSACAPKAMRSLLEAHVESVLNKANVITRVTDREGVLMQRRQKIRQKLGNPPANLDDDERKEWITRRNTRLDRYAEIGTIRRPGLVAYLAYDELKELNARCPGTYIPSFGEHVRKVKVRPASDVNRHKQAGVIGAEAVPVKGDDDV